MARVCGAAAGCDRAGLVFHTKNLMTHAAPRNGQPAKLASSRSHSAAVVALLGYVPSTPAASEPGVKQEPSGTYGRLARSAAAAARRKPSWPPERPEGQEHIDEEIN